MSTNFTDATGSYKLALVPGETLAIDCVVALAPLHTLPRTSSAKLSRPGARQDYIEVANDLDSSKIKAGATLQIPQ